MTQRYAHLVGALPWDTNYDALQAILSPDMGLAEHLRSVPDGETGYRHMWIGPELVGLSRLPFIRTGNPTATFLDYQDVQTYAVEDGHTLAAGELLGLFPLKEGVTASHPLFQDLRFKAGLPSTLDFQAGLASPVDFARLAFGDAGLQPGLYRPVAEAKAAVANACTAMGNDIILQIEMVVPTVSVIMAAEPARAEVARYFAALLAEFGQLLTPGTRVIFHLCVGDLGHRKMAAADSAEPFVILANALAEAWRGPIELIHAPAAMTEDPPSRDPAWYAALGKLAIAPQTRWAVGLVHESRSVQDTWPVIDMAEQALGRQVVLAAPCGLGRRADRAEAMDVLAKLAELAAG